MRFLRRPGHAGARAYPHAGGRVGVRRMHACAAAPCMHGICHAPCSTRRSPCPRTGVRVILAQPRRARRDVAGGGSPPGPSARHPTAGYRGKRRPRRRAPGCAWRRCCNAALLYPLIMSPRRPPHLAGRALGPAGRAGRAAHRCPARARLVRAAERRRRGGHCRDKSLSRFATITGGFGGSEAPSHN